MSKFYSAYNLPKHKPVKGVFSKFSKRYREDFSGGEPHLVVDGVDPLYDLIQAAAPGQMIYNIIDRYATLDDLISELPSGGITGDIERMPSDLRSAYEYINGLRDRFPEVADQVDGTFGDFLDAIQNNQIEKILKQKESESDVGESSESSSES